MRWQAKAPVEYGARRTVRRFAWWPTHVNNNTPGGCYLWLEPYEEEQRYTSLNEYGDRWTVWNRSPVPEAAHEQG